MQENVNYHSVLVSIKIGIEGGNLAQSNKIKDRILYNPVTVLLEYFLHNMVMQIYTRVLTAASF